MESDDRSVDDRLAPTGTEWREGEAGFRYVVWFTLGGVLHAEGVLRNCLIILSQSAIMYQKDISNRYIKENDMARERKIDMVILGLLSHEDLTGYDIKKRIDGAISFFWKGSFGNIYPALKGMENQGLITKNDTSVGGREKTTYHITESGSDALKDWLKEEQASNELKYETLLKLFFGGAESREISIHNIEVFEEQIQKDLKVLKKYSEAL